MVGQRKRWDQCHNSTFVGVGAILRPPVMYHANKPHQYGELKQMYKQLDNLPWNSAEIVVVTADTDIDAMFLRKVKPPQWCRALISWRKNLEKDCLHDQFFSSKLCSLLNWSGQQVTSSGCRGDQNFVPHGQFCCVHCRRSCAYQQDSSRNNQVR